jgi:hypothetical protein
VEAAELGHLRGGRRWRRRFGARRLDSGDGEDQRGEAVSMASSPASGESVNGEGGRRPWRWSRACAREEAGELRERERSRGERGTAAGHPYPRPGSGGVDPGRRRRGGASGGVGRDTEHLID